MKKHILILSNDNPFPVNTGGRKRTWHFIETLKQNYELSILYFNSPQSTKAEREEESKHFQKFWPIDRKQPQSLRKNSALQRIKDLITATPWEKQYRYSITYAKKLAEILSQYQFDFIFARYIYQAQYLSQLASKLNGVKVILDFDDIDTRKAVCQMAVSGFNGVYDKFRQQMNNHFLENYFKKILRTVDTCLVCSEDEKQYLRQKKFTDKIRVIPNAIDFAQYQIQKPITDEKVILFCGVLNYEPNKDGILWFVRNIFPKITQTVPDVKLLLVGRDPDNEIMSLANNQSIVIHRDVPSVIPYYDQARLFVVPIRFASGTRLKILEAAACRRPIVTTTLGAEGLNLQPQTHCLMEDTADHFAQACIEILNNKELAMRLAEKNYEFIKRNYEKSIVSKSINAVFSEL